MIEKKYDHIVVGGGIAGLTASVYLARSGQSVLLIEKNKETGGLVNTFIRDGFTFDAGVRALLDAGIIFPMFKELGIELKHVKSPVSLGIENEIINIESVDDIDTYRKLLLKFYPDSKEDIEKIIKSIRKIMKHMDVLYGIENPVFKDIIKDREFLFKKLLPWLPKFLLTIRKINRLNMPVEEYLGAFVDNPRLMDIISQHFFKNTPAFFAMSYFSLYLDYFYPEGGVKKLADKVHAKSEEYGANILTGTTISYINVKENFVKDSSGNKYCYNNLVWAADLKTFYRIADISVLPEPVLKKIVKRKVELNNSRGCDSVFSVFIEVNLPLQYFREKAHGHFFYTPSSEGMGAVHREELDSLLSNFESRGKEDVLEWMEKFTALNTYEISIPGLKDATMVPEGKTGIIVSLLAEYNLFKKIKEAGWYEEFKTILEDRILKVLSASVYHDLKGNVIKKFSFSPLSIEERVGSSEGSIVGWTFERPLPVVNKIQISDRSVYTPFKNIYQAGQWVYSPAGVPMSILTGRLAADKIIKKTK